MQSRVIISIILLLNTSTAMSDILEDFDSLGGNKIILEKAQSLAPDQKISIVQDRIVSRSKRHEFSPEVSRIIGGSAFLETQSAALTYNYHFNPRWSMGLRYSYYFNELNKDGLRLVKDAKAAADAGIPILPDMNWQKQSSYALLNWYPLYGKFNVLDKGIIHFDFYTILGAGNVELRYGSATSYTAGAGMGMWFSKHLTSRVEFRYESFKSKGILGATDNHLASLAISLGYML